MDTPTTPASDLTVDPAERATRGTVVDDEQVVGALSPTAMAEFRDCALRYRLRRIDRVPEPRAPEALRGTLVHRVLELLFDLPAAEREPASADALVDVAWAELAEAEPDLADAVPADERATWLAPCRAAVAAYFDLEDPRRLEPADRELYVEALLGSRLLLRGVVDRLDQRPDGALRVVDYKSGRAPAAGFEQRALAQLRVYALVLWRSRGVVPQELRLVYLGDGQIISHSPDVAELEATERSAEALWAAVSEASATGGFEANPGFACRWCTFQELCPAWGGTPPPYVSPEKRAERRRREADEAVAHDPAPPGLDLGVGGHDQHGAPGGLGGGGAGG